MDDFTRTVAIRKASIVQEKPPPEFMNQERRILKTPERPVWRLQKVNPLVIPKELPSVDFLPAPPVPLTEFPPLNIIPVPPQKMEYEEIPFVPGQPPENTNMSSWNWHTIFVYPAEYETVKEEVINEEGEKAIVERRVLKTPERAVWRRQKPASAPAEEEEDKEIDEIPFVPGQPPPVAKPGEAWGILIYPCHGEECKILRSTEPLVWRRMKLPVPAEKTIEE